MQFGRHRAFRIMTGILVAVGASSKKTFELQNNLRCLHPEVQVVGSYQGYFDMGMANRAPKPEPGARTETKLPQRGRSATLCAQLP